MPQVVQRLVGHPPGQRTVADDRHDPSLALHPAYRERRRKTVCVRQRRRRVRVLDPVVLGLRPVRIPAQATRLSQGLEPVPPSRQQLVYVGLVARVPQQHVTRRVEHPVQRQRQLDRTQVRPQVPPGRRHRLDDEGPYFLAQLGQLFAGQGLDVGGRLDTLQNHDGKPQATRCSRPAAVRPPPPTRLVERPGAPSPAPPRTPPPPAPAAPAPAPTPPTPSPRPARPPPIRHTRPP